MVRAPDAACRCEEFLTGGRRGSERERALLTVLFSDIVGSTELVAELGDKRWRDLLSVHESPIFALNENDV